MAIIKPRRGTGFPTGLTIGELAVDPTNRIIYLGTAGGGGITVGFFSTDYVSSFNGLTGAVQGVSSFNGLTGALQGVSSVNGKTGAVVNVAFTDITNFFTAQQIITTGGLSASASSNTLNITHTGTNSSGLVVAQAFTGANAQKGKIRLGRADNNNISIQNDGGTFGVYSVGNTDVEGNDIFTVAPGNGGGAIFDAAFIRLKQDKLSSGSSSQLIFSVKDAGALNSTAALQGNTFQDQNTVQYLPIVSGTLLNDKTPYVSGICGATGAITLSAGDNMTITRSGNTFTFSSRGVDAGSFVSVSVSGNTFTVTNEGVRRVLNTDSVGNTYGIRRTNTVSYTHLTLPTKA